MNLGYVRISTQKQSLNTSLENQRNKINDYCKLHDLPLDNIFEEIDSGGNDNRIVFNKLKELIQNELINTIIIYTFIGAIHWQWQHKKSTVLYTIHSFHHQYDKILLPSIGNAVRTMEFISAYLLPFIIAAYLLRPNEISFIIPIGISLGTKLFAESSKENYKKYVLYFLIIVSIFGLVRVSI